MIVKLQYKDFEPGEFTAIKDRSCQETIAVIDAFPWEEQRDQLRVGLTTPSVTVESPTGEFLKLALYYSGKFALYYIDCHHREFRHILTAYGDSAEAIRAFFEAPSTPPEGFVSQQTLLQNIMQHFRTGDFTYRMNPARIGGVIGLICLFLVFPTLFSFMVLARGQYSMWPFLIPGVAFLIYAIALVVLLVNHYRSANSQVLVLSLGLREFSYGPAGNPVQFNKDDIAEIITHGMRAKGGYPALTRVEIMFKDGRGIDISCLILAQESLVSKFPGCPQTTDQVFLPFI